MRAACRLLAGVALLVSIPAQGQQKRFDQDPALDNLVHAEDYATCEPGTLGRVTRVGNGPHPMILIAGVGFGGEVFDSFMETRTDRYTMYAVTLPGFAGTAAPPMPPSGTSYGEQTWTRGVREAVSRLIDKEQLDRPILVAHWFTAPQVALGLALERPREIGAVIVISGIARYDGGMLPATTRLDGRIAYVDGTLAPSWFRTVTRDTWDDNNFYPGDYARHPVRALQLWREAAAAELPVWIRYLCEGWGQDITLDLSELTVPTLLLQPGFDEDFFFVEGQNYMQAFCRDSWNGVAEGNEHITAQVIADTRAFMMDDQPAALDAAVDAFLAGPGSPGPR